MKEADWLTRDS